MTKKQDSLVSTWRELLKSYKSIERSIALRLQANYKQSLSRYDVLEQLSKAEEDWLQVGELAGRLVDTAGGISALLTRMEKENLITRRLNPDDRRSFHVAVTDKGRRLYEDMAADYSTWVASAMEDLSEEDQEYLVQLFSRLKTTPAAVQRTK